MKRSIEDTPIVFIGAGNLATNLAKALYRKGFRIVQVYSRTEDSARRLAEEVEAEFTIHPEDINSSPEGAPSKRLLALKSDYNKVLEGNLIALEVGIMSMLEKCPRFNRWITQIIDTCKV